MADLQRRSAMTASFTAARARSISASVLPRPSPKRIEAAASWRERPRAASTCEGLPALQAGGDESLFKENDKKFDVGTGTIEMKVTAVNAELGEFGGVFVQKQPSDTDLGSKQPKEVLLKGQFFGTVNN